MLFQKRQFLLNHLGGTGDQLANRAQAELTAGKGCFAGIFQGRAGMLLGQCHQPHQHASSFNAASTQHRLGPRGAVRADPVDLVHQPLRAPFHTLDLLGSQMFRLSAEAPRFMPWVNCDLRHLPVEHPHHARIPADPDRAAQILRWNRVVSLHHLRMAVAMDLTLGFLKQGEPFSRQGTQCRSFCFREDLTDMLPRGPVHPRVGHGLFPAIQVLVLFLQTAECSPLECVPFDVANASLDLPLVPRHVRLRRQDRRPIVSTEVPQLRLQFGIVPVGMNHRRPKVVDHDRLGHASQAPEGVFQTSQEVLRRLPIRNLAVLYGDN